MKRKLMILAAGVMVTLASCNKENGVNSAKVPVQQTKAISYNAVIADRAANPQNPYDSIGMIHNEVLKTVIAYEQKTGDTTATTINRLVATFFKTRYGADISGQLVQSGKRFNADFPGMQFTTVPAGKILPTTVAYLNKILSAVQGLKDSTAYGQFKTEIVNLESTVMADKTLASSEQQHILMAAAVARYSLSFWLTQTNMGNGKNDVMGFFHNVWKAIFVAGADTCAVIDGIIHWEKPRVILEDASDESGLVSALWDL